MNLGLPDRWRTLYPLGQWPSLPHNGGNDMYLVTYNSVHSCTYSLSLSLYIYIYIYIYKKKMTHWEKKKKDLTIHNIDLYKTKEKENWVSNDTINIGKKSAHVIIHPVGLENWIIREFCYLVFTKRKDTQESSAQKLAHQINIYKGTEEICIKGNKTQELTVNDLAAFFFCTYIHSVSQIFDLIILQISDMWQCVWIVTENGWKLCFYYLYFSLNIFL